MQRSEIINKIVFWLNNTWREEKIPDEVIALNFGIQRTFNEYEIYISGHDDFYYDHDTWLLSSVYQPKNNFYGLGIESLEMSDKEIFTYYKSEVQNNIDKIINVNPHNIKYFTCSYPGGMPELLKEI